MQNSAAAGPEQPQQEAGAAGQMDDDDEFFDSEDDETFNVPDDSACMVEQGLWIGCFLSELNWEKLQAQGITHVLQVAECAQPSHPDKFAYKTIHVQDSPAEDLVAHFGKCFAFIEDAVAKGGSCLVHCMAGVSRSSAVCIGYLMKKHHLSYEDAYRRVHAVRACVMPNEGFRKQLKEFHAINYDLSKWKAWRHTWKEDPLLKDPLSVLLSNHVPTHCGSGTVDLMAELRS